MGRSGARDTAVICMVWLTIMSVADAVPVKVQLVIKSYIVCRVTMDARSPARDNDKAIRSCFLPLKIPQMVLTVLGRGTLLTVN